jgi:hypothetical protein
MSETNLDNVEALKRIKLLVNETYQASLELKKSEDKYNKLKSELSKLMESAEIDTIDGDNCKAYCAPKSSVSLPKSISQKKQVFDYISKKYGEEVLAEMLTINPRSFNSWFNEEANAALSEGELDFNLADIKPFTYFSVSFRKKSASKS